MAHHFGAWLAVAIGVFVAVAISLWAGFLAGRDTDA